MIQNYLNILFNPISLVIWLVYSLLISYALYQIVYVKLKYTENINPNLD